MSNEPTKADLAAELEAFKAQSDRLIQAAESRYAGLDPEAKAISIVVKALEPLVKTTSSFSGYGDRKDSSAVHRVLVAAAARFGLMPDWDILNKVAARLDISEGERQELARLRHAIGEIQDRAGAARWVMPE